MRMVVTDYLFVYSENLAAFWKGVKAVTGKTLLASIGGGGVPGDWDIMKQYTFQSQVVLADLIGYFGLSGLDFDWEDGPSEAITQFVPGFRQQQPNATLTLCPYDGTFETLLNIWQALGQKGFNWMNAQMYEGESNYDPKRFKTIYVEPLRLAFKVMPEEAASLLVPGWNAQSIQLSDLANNIKSMVGQYKTLGGAFVWDLPSNQNVSQWAGAMDAALKTP